MSQPKVAIIVLNFNGEDCLLACLRSLSSLEYENREIIVVDNASTDTSFELAKKQFPSCVFISSETNRGFAGGMNLGMREAMRRNAEWFWLFNSDAKAQNESLDLLLTSAKKFPQTGIFSPIIIKGISTVWFGKGRINHGRMRAEHVSPTAREIASPAYGCDYVTGCAMLIRKSVVDTIGLLDESFFLYYEDADFCLRAREKGFECMVVPGARIFHAEKSEANSSKIYYLVYSGLLFFQMHGSRLGKLYYGFYVTIRKIKNRLDILLGRENAELVRRAYDDFSHESGNHSLTHLR